MFGLGPRNPSPSHLLARDLPKMKSMRMKRRRTSRMKVMTTRMMMTRRMTMKSDSLGMLVCSFFLFGVSMPKGEKLIY